MFYIVLREQIYMEIFQVIRLLKIKILGIYIIIFIISSKRSFFMLMHTGSCMKGNQVWQTLLQETC